MAKKKKNSRLIIIDGNNQAYRSYHSHARLAPYKGKPVNMIYGFMNILKPLCADLQSNNVVVVWDGKRSKRRMELLPGYKEGRKSKLGFDREDFFRQKTEVQRILESLGIPQYHSIDMEADDHIYVLRKAEIKQKVTIVSSDKDFLQLVNARTKVYNPIQQTLYSIFNIHQEIGVHVTQFVDYLCLTGDKSDKIPGYPGIGDKRAIDFLKRYNSIQHFLDNFPEYATTTKVDVRLLEDIYNRNRELIDIRYFVKQNLKGVTPKLLYSEYSASLSDFYGLTSEAGIRRMATKKYFEYFQ